MSILDIAILATIMLLVLKLTGVVTIGWFAVISPVVVAIAIVFIIALVVAIVEEVKKGK